MGPQEIVFVWVAVSPFSRSGQGLVPIAEQIETIESEGWRLEDFSTAWSTSGTNHLIGTAFFRRVLGPASRPHAGPGRGQ